MLTHPAPDMLALAARNADGAAPDLMGLRVYTQIEQTQPLVGGPSTWADHIGNLYAFGAGVFDLRVWIPDREKDEAVESCQIDGIVCHVFEKNSRQIHLNGVQTRSVEELDVLVWTQMCHVGDRAGLIPLTRYGFVSRIEDERVVIARTTRDEAFGVKASAAVARRVES